MILRSITLRVISVTLLVLPTFGWSQDDQIRSWVVTFNEAGLLNYTGDTPGLSATRPATGEKLAASSQASLAYMNHLKTLKDQRVQTFNQSLNRVVKPRYHYRATRHGVLLDLTTAEAEALRQLPEVASVTAEPVLELDTERGPGWINAPMMWDGTSAPDSLPHLGEGVVVGVIDSGINTDHPAYAAVGPIDSYEHVNPLGDGVYLGHCIGGSDEAGAPNAPVQCNSKLIGAWAFTQAVDTDAPEDNNGHGSHTASTSAGNIQSGPFFDAATGLAIGVGQISGVAPHANIIAYDVCESNTCSASSAGIDQAILDGVDVINFSISGGNNPWNDNDRVFLDAVNAGIIVAASAGNTRDNNPNPEGDVSHIGPWVMTVAASTHDRDGTAELTAMTGGTNPPSDMQGSTLTADFGPADVVYAGNFDDGDNDPATAPEQCLVPFPAGTWNGEIVLCDRGSIARVAKGQNVLAGGAGGMILANVDGGADGTTPDFHVLPSIHVDIAEGNDLRTWLAAGSSHMATITGPVSGGNPATADVIADFSLRGPNLSFDVTKPDITGPGVSIIAAVQNDPSTPAGSSELGFRSGTSMSSPHLAGAAALIRQAHPDWSVAEVKSALMMTAARTAKKEDNATPATSDDVGNGRVDLSTAALAGLVMNETFDNYLAANPANGGDPATLNIPSVRSTVCSPTCSWTRTVVAAQEIATDWQLETLVDDFTISVTPAAFKLAERDLIFRDQLEEITPDQPAVSSRQQIQITASNVSAGNLMDFGWVLFNEQGGLAPQASISVAVSEILPDVPPQ